MTATLPDPERFEVQLTGLEHLRGPERQVIYHGVNKSGSLAMTNVLYHGYHAANRANQFFSTYRGLPTDDDTLRALINRSTGHAFFGGHYLYGAYASRPGQQVLTTQFRNPLPRVRSAYQWLSNKQAAAGEPFTAFEEWVVKTRGVSHSQVAQFAVGFGVGPERRTRLQGMGGEQLLDLALVNIERDVDWFGIAEYFEESAFCMAAICGLPSIRPWSMDTRNKDRPLVTEWPQEHVELVREVFRWDFLLYEWALERFRASVASLAFGPELERYKQACADQYKDRLDADGTAVTGELLGGRRPGEADGPPGGGHEPDVVDLVRSGALARLSAAEESRKQATGLLARADTQAVESVRQAVASGLHAHEIAKEVGMPLEAVVALLVVVDDD